MKIGIISDTHDAHKNVLKAIEIFNERGVEYVFHAGDMVSPFTAKAFGRLNGAKFIAVFGNCDGERVIIKSSIESFGGEVHAHSYKGGVEGRKIFMTHIPNGLEEVAESGKYDLVIYGHTHKQDIRKAGDTLIVNPGETTDWVTGESGIVVLELDDMSYEIIKL
jgi:putative phosphoesterase